MSEKTKNALLTLVKGSVSAGLIYFLLTRIDLSEFIINLKQFPFWMFIPITIVFCATVFVAGWRWKIFIAPFGKISYLKLVRMYFVGYFFNNFLPSGVGGDVVRGYMAGKEMDNMAGAYSSIIAERVAGTVATLFISIIALPFAPFRKITTIATIVLNVALWGGLSLFLLLRTENAVKKILSFIPWGFGEKAAKFIVMLRSYRHNTGLLVKGFVASVIYQALIITILVITSIVAGAKLPLSVYYLTVPLVWVISLLPISLNALGVRESSFAYFFELFGESAGKGFLVSLSFFAFSIIAGIIGGIIFALWNNAMKRKP